MRVKSILLGACVGVVASVAAVGAAPTWVRIESPHFTVVSDAGEKEARDAAWQFEQVHAVLGRVWPWARLDTGRPILVFAVRGENGVKALAPEYWEKKGGVRPDSIFHSASDRHYVVVRTDVEISRREVNPYRSAYWSYIGIVVDSTFSRSLPPWLTRGLAEVMSNTIVRTSDLTIGQIVPWNLERLRRGRLTFRELTTATRDSALLGNSLGMELFDASAWALVHYLMFGEQGANLPRFSQAATAILKGSDVDRAIADAFGGVAGVTSGYDRYSTQPTFTYQRVEADVDVRAQAFTSVVLTPAEAAATRALYLAASGRTAEAVALIAEARVTAPDLGLAYEVEGILADKADRRDEAKAAYAKASERGGAGFYAEYRLAWLSWPRDDDPQRAATLAGMVPVLERSIATNPSYAWSRSLLAQVLLRLDRVSDAAPHAQRAVVLAPSESSVRLTMARVMHAQGRAADAKAEADRASGLARSADDRSNAQAFIAYMGRAAQASAASAEADQQRAWLQQCQAGSADACGKVAPAVERACEGGEAQACLVLGYLYEQGRGVTADESRAATLYDKACAGGFDRACVAHASLQWRGAGVTQDETTALARFAALCEKGVDDGCLQYAMAASTRPTPAGTRRAREIFDQRCTAGMAKACEILAGWPK